MEEGNGVLVQLCISKGLSNLQKDQAISQDHRVSEKIQEVPLPDLYTQSEDSLAVLVFADSYSTSGMLWSTVFPWGLGIGEKHEQTDRLVIHSIAHIHSANCWLGTLKE